MAAEAQAWVQHMPYIPGKMLATHRSLQGNRGCRQAGAQRSAKRACLGTPRAAEAWKGRRITQRPQPASRTVWELGHQHADCVCVHTHSLALGPAGRCEGGRGLRNHGAQSRQHYLGPLLRRNISSPWLFSFLPST